MGKTMEQYIAETSEAMKQNLSNRKRILEPMICALSRQRSDKLVIVASGSSCHAAVCAKGFMERYLGGAVEIQTPFTFTYYGKVKPSRAYLFVSQSGSSTNMLAALRKCKMCGQPAIAVVGKKASAVGLEADVAVEYGVGEEAVGYVTKGMSTLTLFFMLLAMEYAEYQPAEQEAKEPGRTAYREDLLELQRAAENHYAVYRYAKEYCRNNEKAMLSMKHVFFLGCGANMGTAKEGALKLSEMLHVQTGAFEAEEFLHGPDLQLTPDYTLFFIHGGDKAGERVEEICEAAREVTDHSYLVSVKNMPVEPTKEEITPLYLTAFFHYLAYYAAKELKIIGEHPLFERFEERISCKTEDYTEEAPF